MFATLGFGRAVAVQGVHSPEMFRAGVRRERARSDRNSHGFVVVAFDVGGNGDRPQRAQALIRLLGGRCRLTDQVGWLDEKMVGVILPYTNHEGAQVFAKVIQETWALPDPAPTRRVYAYPGEKTPSGQDDRAGGRPNAPSESEPPLAAIERPVSRAAESIDAILDRPRPFWKRAMDVIGACGALLMFAPIMAGMALFIKIVSPGPAFFLQERVGYLGRRFVCWKFRTMRARSRPCSHEAHVKRLMLSGAPLTKLDAADDPRIIPFGMLLRQSGFDELPQLFNVIKGDMSLVGPRPCVPYEYEAYHRWQRTRTEAHPGLTGLWQVSGKNRTTFLEMLRLDIRYARDMSPWLDIRIMLRTFWAIVIQIKNGYAQRRARVMVRAERPSGLAQVAFADARIPSPPHTEKTLSVHLH